VSVDSSATFRTALELFEAALLEARVERQLAEARVAKFKAAAELERAGRHDEARTLIDEVRREQAQAFGETDGDAVARP
jgi:multidrug efflux pump subunit AcrA (membrane-fusion protein)